MSIAQLGVAAKKVGQKAEDAGQKIKDRSK
jgi:hypothetical protein